MRYDIREKGNPGWLYDGISGTDGDSDHGPVSCFDRGLSVSGNLTGSRMRHPVNVFCLIYIEEISLTNLRKCLYPYRI